MKSLAKLLLVFAATTLAAQPPAAPATKAAPVTMLYVFGDSYSDSGSGYADTNGLTAVAYMAQDLHIPFTYYGDPNSKGKGLNFAISGSQSGEGNGRRYPTGQMLGIGMKNQVDNFVAIAVTGVSFFNLPGVTPGSRSELLTSSRSAHRSTCRPNGRNPASRRSRRCDRRSAPSRASSCRD